MHLFITRSDFFIFCFSVKIIRFTWFNGTVRNLISASLLRLFYFYRFSVLSKYFIFSDRWIESLNILSNTLYSRFEYKTYIYLNILSLYKTNIFLQFFPFEIYFNKTCVNYHNYPRRFVISRFAGKPTNFTQRSA